MRDTVRAVVILALTFGAAPLSAQNPGLPVYNLGVPRGIGLYGDLDKGIPTDEYASSICSAVITSIWLG